MNHFGNNRKGKSSGRYTCKVECTSWHGVAALPGKRLWEKEDHRLNSFFLTYPVQGFDSVHSLCFAPVVPPV